jgi:hypothetical protein
MVGGGLRVPFFVVTFRPAQYDSKYTEVSQRGGIFRTLYKDAPHKSRIEEIKPERDLGEADRFLVKFLLSSPIRNLQRVCAYREVVYQQQGPRDHATRL